jgi:cell division protein FtsW
MGEAGRKGRERRGPDYVLIVVVAALVLLGLLMVYSTTFDWGYLEAGDPFRQVRRQVIWLLLGVGVAVLLARVDYGYWLRLAVPVLGGTLLLLALLLLVGNQLWGARRSLLHGSIQPGELAKLVTVIYAAAWISSKGEQVRDVTYGLIPFAVWMGAVAGLVVLQPDLSAAAILALSGFAVFFLAGAHLGQLFIAGAVGGAVFWGLVLILPHAHDRVKEFILSLQDPTLLPYHPRQALYALAEGGVFGAGLGQGRVKFGYLPMAHNDAIFAVVGEELGLVGCLLVVGMFGLLAWRGFRIALRAQDSFGNLLAGGLTCLLVFQVALNLGAITSLLPFTGTTLPFISLGGSSLVVSLAAVGLLLSVSRGRPPGRKGAADRARGKNGSHLDRRGRNGRARLSRSGRPAGA